MTTLKSTLFFIAILCFAPVMLWCQQNDDVTVERFNNTVRDYYGAKRYKEAITYTDSLLDVNINASPVLKREYWFSKGKSHTHLKEWKEAFTAYRNADSLLIIKTRVDSAFAANLYFQQALNLYNLSEYQQAYDKYAIAAEYAKGVFGENDGLLAHCYHNMGSSLEAIGKSREAIEWYQKSLRIRNIVYGKTSAESAHCYHNLAICNLRINNLDTALIYAHNALEIRKRLHGDEHPDIASNYNLIGGVYFYQENYAMTYEYVLKAYEMRIKQFGIYSPNNISSLLNLGGLCLKTKRWSKALDYYSQALVIQELKGETGKEAFSQIYNGMGSSYFSMDQYKKAIVYFQKADSINSIITDKVYIDPIISFNSAVCYKKLAEYDKAKYIFYKNIRDTELKHLEEMHGNVLTPYMHLAEIYIAENKMDSVDYIINRVDSILANYKIIPNDGYRRYFRELSRYYVTQDNLDKAIEYFKFSKSDESDYDITDIKPFANIDLLLHRSFEQYLYTQKYKKSRNTDDFNRSLELGRQNTDLFIRTRSILDGDALITSSEELYHIFTNYMDVLTDKPDINDYTKEDMKRLYGIAEASKSYNLYSEYLKNTKETHQQTDDALALAKNQLRLMQESDIRDASYDSKVFILKEKIDSLDKIKSRILFDKQKYDFNMDIDSLQNTLADNQSILSYFVINRKDYLKIICFHLTKEGLTMTITTDTIQLDNYIQQLHSGITAYFTSDRKTDQLMQESLVQYSEYAYKLYQLLIKPVATGLKRDITLIPDFKLSGLSFGSLMSSMPDNIKDLGTYPFLEKNRRIRYIASAKFLEDEYKVNNDRAKVIAFAPFADDNSIAALNRQIASDESDYPEKGFQSLPNSASEAQTITKISKGKMYIKDQATIYNFFDAVQIPHSVIHLATHSRFNTANHLGSYIAFAKDSVYNGILSMKEIHLLNCKSNMVVLSSCESGAGKQTTGEGVIGLTYGLTSAGVQSVISSLWLVDDKGTSDLMVEFYKNLAAGKDKSEALHLAKLHFINNKTMLKKHPFYWSAFNLYGKSDKITF